MYSSETFFENAERRGEREQERCGEERSRVAKNRRDFAGGEEKSADEESDDVEREKRRRRRRRRRRRKEDADENAAEKERNEEEGGAKSVEESFDAEEGERNVSGEEETRDRAKPGGARNATEREEIESSSRGIRRGGRISDCRRF